MIFQGDRKIHTLCPYKLYGELQAQESIVLKDCADLGGPLALVAQTPQLYEADSEYDDEEEFENAIALISKQFNRLPPTSFRKNQFHKPTFDRNFNSQNNHHRFTNPSPQPSQLTQQKEALQPISDSGTSSENRNDIVICHKCNKENHFAKY